MSDDYQRDTSVIPTHHDHDTDDYHKVGHGSCSHSHNHDHHEKAVDHVCLLETDAKFQKKLKDSTKAMKKLGIVVLICFLFMIVEIAGGVMSDSLAILSDAAHMLSDVSGFLISLIAIWIGMRKPTLNNSWGYHRAEVIGALASIFMIWIMVFWLFKKALGRVYDDNYHIDGQIMFSTAIISLVCNIFSLIALGHGPCCNSGDNILHSLTSVYQPHGGCSHDHGDGAHDHVHDEEHGHSHAHHHDHTSKTSKHIDHDHKNCSHGIEDVSTCDSCNECPEAKLESVALKECDHTHEHHDHDHQHDHAAHSHSHEETNMNIRAAVVHVIGDMLQSIGVIIAAGLIWYNPEYKFADPACTFLFSILVMFTTIPVFQDCMRILMEKTPKTTDPAVVRDDIIKNTKGLKNIEDFHIWTISGGKYALLAHLRVSKESDPEEVHESVSKTLGKYGICHITLQILKVKQ